MKASLIWPFEQRFVNSVVNELVLKEWEVKLWRERCVIEVRGFTNDFPMHLSWFRLNSLVNWLHEASVLISFGHQTITFGF